MAHNPDIISYQRDGLVLRRRVVHTTVLPLDTLYNDSRCALVHGTLYFGDTCLHLDGTNAVQVF